VSMPLGDAESFKSEFGSWRISIHSVSELITPNSELLRAVRLQKTLSFLDRLGCRNFLSAFASICRILSRVTSKSCPTSSRVWSYFSPMPKRILSTFSSLGVRLSRTFRVVSERFMLITASWGETTPYPR